MWIINRNWFKTSWGRVILPPALSVWPWLTGRKISWPSCQRSCPKLRYTQCTLKMYSRQSRTCISFHFNCSCAFVGKPALSANKFWQGPDAKKIILKNPPVKNARQEHSRHYCPKASSLVPSHWGLGLKHMIWEEYKNSV